MSLDDGRLVSNFAVAALKGEPLQIYGDGQATSSMSAMRPVIRSCTNCEQRRMHKRRDAGLAAAHRGAGPRMSLDDGRLVSNFAVAALKGEPLQIYGDGQDVDWPFGVGRLHERDETRDQVVHEL
jgi:nucleoside-diphosphate-sugar epimerase